jgi:hypothetical protein
MRLTAPYFDENLSDHISYKQRWSIPHRGIKICHRRSLRSLPLHRVCAVLYCADMFGGGASEASGTKYNGTNTYC